MYYKDISQIKNVLLVVTGSVAAYKAASLASLIRHSGKYITEAIMTDSALQFVQPASFVAGNTTVWTDKEWFGDNSLMFVPHIETADLANVVVVYPASANIIAKMANGIADDLASTTLLVAIGMKKRIIVCPAMNTNMYEAATTQANINKLKDMGVEIIEPVEGHLACGTTGKGHIVDEKVVLDRINAICEEQNEQDIKSEKEENTKPLNIVVTGGGTSEHIDPVRKITNTGTGSLACAIIEKLYKNINANITYIATENAKKPNIPENEYTLVTVTDTMSVLAAVNNALYNKDVDLFIHSMAISDYCVESVSDKNMVKLDNSVKLSSDEDTLIVKLVKTPKVINTVKMIQPNTTLVGFKLLNNVEDEKLIDAAKKQINSAGSDYVIANDASKINGEKHPALLIRKDSQTVTSMYTKDDITDVIVSIARITMKKRDDNV